MDRDNRWDRVKKAYDAMVLGSCRTCDDPIDALEQSYGCDVTDEFFLPTAINGTKRKESGDSFVFFNFRPDRAREITRAFVDENFGGFERGEKLQLNYVCMTTYDEKMPNVDVAFEPQTLKNTFGEYISQKGLTQLRIAETEKYAHVTFFFNGGTEKIYRNEERILVPSPKVATYDQQPEMSANEVTQKVLDHIKHQKEDVIILNFANCDMIGHTGNFAAAVQATEVIDRCVGAIVEQIKKVDGVAILSADHGNADKMMEKNGSPFTAHTTNPVPFCIINYECKLKEGGNLADIAPTMLKILDIKKPAEMTGTCRME
jgi:2,3-bisphosphoglycerate-independent phosphoglycerate mutase